MIKVLGCLIFLALCFPHLGAHAQRSSPPNIVFILADDLGWKDLGCYGNLFNETPNLNKLASKGIRFNQAYAACPVCSPTRASILTGKYPARLKLTNYITGNRVDNNSSIIPPKWKPYLDTAEITLPELLKSKGFVTGMVGKWHLHAKDSTSLRYQGPWGQGFDYSRMIGKNGLDYYNYSILRGGTDPVEFEDNGTVYLTDKLTEYGVEFIKSNAKKPFFLYLAYSAPHVMLVPRADKLGKYLQKYNRIGGGYNPSYGCMVESIDDGVGQIIQTLKDKGLLENTIIVFTSDNGGLGMPELGPTPTTNEPLKKWKGHTYEGGIRVPAIVSWLGTIPEGKVSDTYYSSIDYLSTFCEIVGIKELPANTDGKSVWPLFLNPANTELCNRPVFWHFPHFSNQMGRPSGAVRLGDYKLVEQYEDQKIELYNLASDVSEEKDLSVVEPFKTKELYKLLSDWRIQVNAQMPLPNPKQSGKPGEE